MAEAFCNWVRPSLTRLLADRTFSETLAPLIARETLTRLSELAEGLVSLSATYGSLAASLDHLQSLRRKELEALAFRFGITPPAGASAEALISLLEKKAADLPAYQAQIAALDDRVAAIANLKGAAQDAAARLDFDEVESLLSRVHEVELDIAAATAEARAENALMQGNAEKAFTLFSAAADSFAALGPVELARRRRTYADRLEEHGIRYGGAGLPLAIRLLDRLLTDLPQDAAPWDWAAAQNSLAIAFRNLGERSDGPPGAALLSRAVQAYEAAMQVVTRDSDPEHWAITMQNLAIALRVQGERTAGQDGTALLSRAVQACEQALQVFTRADHPVDWAGTMQNLAIALRVQGERTAGQDGTALLSRAVQAYEQALQVFTRAVHPVHWAGTTQNLAIALQRQGECTAGQDGTTLLSRAVQAYEQALQVFTRADHPVHWAMTQQNLALCHGAWSQHPACDHPAQRLGRALAHVDAALTVYDPDHMPSYHEMATRLRERILSALADKP
jgi:tetratricopeptide (TPR) repeat protein